MGEMALWYMECMYIRGRQTIWAVCAQRGRIESLINILLILLKGDIFIRSDPQFFEASAALPD